MFHSATPTRLNNGIQITTAFHFIQPSRSTRSSRRRRYLETGAIEGLDDCDIIYMICSPQPHIVIEDDIRRNFQQPL